MRHRIVGWIALILVLALSTACGGGKSPQAPAGDSPAAAATARPSETAAAPAAGKSGFRKIGDFLDAWTALYNQNEAVINAYEGMPIMELVTPATSFIGTIQYDLLNPNTANGRFEGVMPLSGIKGVLEKAGSKLTFGYDRTLEKDGFGPLAKAGDHDVEKGTADLDQEYYRAESTMERGGKMISREVSEFKRLPDGSMVCLVFRGQTINARGDEETSDSAIFIHNGKGRYDFVAAKGTTGPGFTPLSFAEKGALSKEQAIEAFRAAGYALEKSGGIKDGKLVLDK